MTQNVAINGQLLTWDHIKVLRRALVAYIEHTTYIIGSYFEVGQSNADLMEKRWMAFELLSIVDDETEEARAAEKHFYVTLYVNKTKLSGYYAEIATLALSAFSNVKTYEQPHLIELYRFLSKRN